ncbi:MAG: radical SAM protein [Planctomycetota bacterium]|nr:radical SAM protein [Planctomycetota bacterium]
MLTARGCGWGRCTFCSDVVTINGRGFRSRSSSHVLEELRHHYDQHQVRLFCFSDLKLNSDLTVWRALHTSMREVVPGAKWTCAIHVGSRPDEGLSLQDLKAARAAGLVRITTGLESGSPDLLDSMKKGTRPERVREFLSNAKEAGITTRLTLFTGYPGEDASHLAETASFLEDCQNLVDRVHLSRLSIRMATPLLASLKKEDPADHGFSVAYIDPVSDEIAHTNNATQARSYRKGIARLLRVTHRINRRPLADFAAELEGAM